MMILNKLIVIIRTLFSRSIIVVRMNSIIYSRLNGPSFPNHFKKFNGLSGGIVKRLSPALNMVTTRMVQSKELTIRSKLLNELLMAFVTSLIFGLKSCLPFLTHTLPSTGRIKEQLMSNLRHELFEKLFKFFYQYFLTKSHKKRTAPSKAVLHNIRQIIVEQH